MNRPWERLRALLRTGLDLALDPVLSRSARPPRAAPETQTPSNVRIRAATRADAETVSNVYARAISMALPRKALDRIIRYYPDLCFVAEEQRRVVGIALCRVRLLGYLRPLSFKTVFLATIAVDDAFRGQGLGRALTQRVLDTSAALGVPEVSLEVDPNNSAAVALYTSCGFSTVKGRRGLGPNSQIMARRTVRADA